MSSAAAFVEMDPTHAARRDDVAIEARIKAKGLTAARVTPAQIDALMVGVTVQTHHFPGTTTTVAMAFLPNGFSVGFGMSACASPQNFDAEEGVKNSTDNALRDAREQLWKLEGYALKQQLSEDAAWLAQADQARQGGFA